MTKVPVYLEAGDKRVFAGATEWPGWCRGAKTEEDALAALAAYGPRYAAVVGKAAGGFEPPEGPEALDVVERLKGGSGTDFGVPGLPPKADERPIDEEELRRLTAILEASWKALDRAALAAEGVELRKGPRGGGRDLDQIVGHAYEADGAYVKQAGGRFRSERSPVDDYPRLRRRLLDVLAARARDAPVDDASAVKRPWLPRYLVRRTAWHVLDHAWEIEERAAPAPPDDA